MRSLTFWLKVTRPLQVIATMLGAWIVALLSNGPLWLTSTKLAAAGSMGLCCLGASLFHYGAAHRMYARKQWDFVEVDRPEVLVGFGLTAMFAAIGLAWLFLPRICVVISAFNLIAIVLYARVLSRTWLTKNIVIGLVCTTPVLVGWLSGHRINPALPYLIGIILCTYIAREIIKDIHDLQANNGIRVTLPMRIGIRSARLIAAGFILLGYLCLFLVGSILSRSATIAILPLIVSFVTYGATFASLVFNKYPGACPRLITVGTWSLMFAALAVRIST